MPAKRPDHSDLLKQMQVIKHIRKVNGCCGTEMATVAADTAPQLIEEQVEHAGHAVDH